MGDNERTTAGGRDPGQPPPPVTIAESGVFSIGEIEFVVDIPPSRPSEPNSFSISKSEPFIRFYESLRAEFRPRGVFELGVLQGGSYVFIDKLFEPRCISAIDLNPDHVEPLEHYVGGRDHHHVHFGVSQSDGPALSEIVEEELSGELDLVIDDASHQYELTKSSFEVLWPLLSPGGLYVIEDWSWAHVAEQQGEGAWLSDEPALTNLLFEQVLLLGSTLLIDEIRVLRFLYLLRKSANAPAVTAPTLWDGVLNRGRTLGKI
jgi:predicted O-methyltransferase YrrM